MWIATVALRATGKKVVRRALWVTGGMAVAAGALLGLDVVIDVLNDRERAAEARANEQAARIADDHDALAAYAASHGVSEPMTRGGTTPLTAAIAKPFPDLVADFVKQGALASEQDLTQAVHSGNPDLVRALLGGSRPPLGREALDAAFEAGDLAMLDTLAKGGADVGGALPNLIDPSKLALYTGEVDWQTLRAKWSAAPPHAVSNSLHARSHGSPGFPANEVDVVEVLADLLRSSDVCFDPALTSTPVEGWMKDTALCTCDHCGYTVAIHWAILASFYGEAIPPLARSKHVAMIRALARQVVASKADEAATVRSAVSNGNVFLLEVLEGEGFDLHVVDGEFAEKRFYEPGDQPKMRDHLAGAGVRWQESE
jgi:hypothetical protein